MVTDNWSKHTHPLSVSNSIIGLLSGSSALADEAIDDITPERFELIPFEWIQRPLSSEHK